ncbi:molybdopterin-dependent oxidoreductase [Brasilonema sp. CT11]|nr:molybdopterin-dependent oxidoreductase [Brasilonema sp. CT11]
MTKHPDLIILEQKPFNAAPPLNLLRQAFITPESGFFVRNHGSIPEVDLVNYRLSVTGNVQQSLNFSLDELRAAFPKRTITATLHCAGNRRDELMKVAPIPDEEAWGASAISNAVWGGVWLTEVLHKAGVEPDAQHVAFSGLDDVEKEGRKFHFGGSIPIAKALNSEVLLAYEMNGEPLTLMHGFPLRVVVPGYIGARSVKWLSKITLQSAPSDNYFQTQAYKLFPPDVQAETADWEQAPMLEELFVNAVICQPADKAILSTNLILVEGYAIAGGNRHIERVELSLDLGTTWVQVQLLEKPQPGTWQFWQHQLELQSDTTELIVRAWDSQGNTQPQNLEQVWNFKGYMNNAWHRVRINKSQ